MSRITLGPSQGNSRLALGIDQARVFEFGVRAAEVLATLGAIPDATLGMLRIRFFDMMDHHRKSVANNAGKTWPAKGRARKFIFAYSSRYGARKKDPTELSDLVGESFMFAPQGAGGNKFWEVHERGGTITSRDPFVIPFDSGAGTLGRNTLLAARFNKAASQGGLGALKIGDVASLINRTNARFSIVNTGATKGLLVQDIPGTGGGKWRYEAVGVVRRTRVVKPMLAFERTFEQKIWPKHSALLERTFEQALTVAGREGQAAKVKEAQTQGEIGRNQYSRNESARRTEFDRNLRQYLLRTGQGSVNSAIRKSIRAAAALEARKTLLAPGGNGEGSFG